MRLMKVYKSAAALIAVGLIFGSSAFAELPSVKLVAAPVVNPDAAVTYYNGKTLSRTGTVAAWTARPPEIQELARSLGAGHYAAAAYATNVYEYVRNNISTEFRFGLSKGARGALIDQSGTPFDQVHLMVELLRQGAIIGNYTVTANYLVGKVTLTGAQFLAWTGISDAKAACQYFADGGIPIAVNSPSATSCPSSSGTAISSITILHPWVLAGGVLYDPSYKIQTKKTGIDLATAMNCKPGGVVTCGSSFLATTLVPNTTQTCGVAGINCVTGISQPGIESLLTSYAVNLQHSIQNTNTTTGTVLALEDVVGGLTIDTSQVPTSGSLLPAAAYGTAAYTWTGDILDPFRTTLTVQFDQINQKLFADEIAGNRLRIFGFADNGATTTTSHYTLYSEYRPLAISSIAGQSGGVATVQLTVSHPYAANSGTYSGETLASQLVELSNECAFGDQGCDPATWHTGVITIISGFGEQSASTTTHFADLQRRDKTNGMPIENPTSSMHLFLHNTNLSKTPGYCIGVQGAGKVPSLDNPWNTCYGEEHGTLAASWLAQTARVRSISSSINASATQNHHSLGIAFSDKFITNGQTNLSLQSMMSVNSTSATASDRTAAFMGIAASMNRLEGGVFEQGSNPFDGGSAISAIVLANATSTPFFDVSSSNVAAFTTYLRNNQTSNLWPEAFLTAITNYATATPEPYKLIVPRDNFAGTFSLPAGNFVDGGTGIAAFGTSSDRVAYLATLGSLLANISTTNLMLKGSGGPQVYDPLADAEQAVKVGDYAVKNRKAYGVALGDGHLNLTPAPDLVTGYGEFPQSLTFQRVYSVDSIGVTDAPVFVDHLDHYLYSTDPDPSPIGGGWTHTLSIKAQIRADAFAGLGRDSAVDASGVIAGMFVQRWLSLGTVDIRSRLANVFVTHWLINGLNRNSVVVTRPPARQAFIKLPDQSFDPGPGRAEKLTQSGAPDLDGYNGAGWVWNGVGVHFTLQDKVGSLITFQQSLPSAGPPVAYPYPIDYLYVPTTWSFPDGVVLSFTYGTASWMAAWNQACLVGVSNNLGRSLSFSNPCDLTTAAYYGGGVQWVKDESGRQVSFYSTAGSPTSGNTLSQNLGPDLFVVAPDNSTTHYSYTPVPSSLTPNRPFYGISKWFTANDSANPFVTVGYDSLFRVSTITDNSVPTAFTTQYFVGGLYGTQVQKRSEIIDALSAVTTSYFDLWGNNIQTIDPLGRVTSHTYDANRRVATTVYPDKNVDSFYYDVRSNLLRTVHSPKPGSTLAATSELISYLEAPAIRDCVLPVTCNKAATTTDSNGNQSTYTYSASGTGQLQRVVGPAVTETSPGISGSAETDYCFTTVSAANVNGAVTTVSLPVATVGLVDSTTNRVASFTYNTLANHFSLLTSVKDPNPTYVRPTVAGGSCTTTAKSGALALTTTFAFDSVGNPASIDGPVSGASDTVSYVFDKKRRLTKITAPLGALTRYCYDLDGELISTNRARVISPTDANDATVGQCTTAYSAAQWQSESRGYFSTGDIKTVIDASGHVTQYAYDPVGRQRVVQDGDGRQSANVYDLAGEVIAEWHGGSGWIDANGQPGSAAPTVNSSWTASTYTGTGPVRYQSYCSSVAGNCYSGNGKQLYAKDADNNLTQYQYDGFDRLQFTYFPDPTGGARCTLATTDGQSPTCSGGQTYEQSGYDSNGNKTSFLTRKGDLLSYVFDANNRVATITTPDPLTFTYWYDLLGESIETIDSSMLHKTIYAYDAVGRRKSEQNQGFAVFYQYDEAGNRTRLTWGDGYGYYVSYSYDALNRMQYVKEGAAATELAYYGYDTLSRRTVSCVGGQSAACIAGNGTDRMSYAYEDDSDLQSLANVSGVPVTLAYTHNNSHQILTLSATDSFFLPTPATTASITFVANALNEYGSIGGVAATSDANGNLKTWSVPGTGSSHSYTYDSENHLKTVTITGSSAASVQFDYDVLGRRNGKTVTGGIATLYQNDGDEEVAEFSNSGGVATLLRRYIPGPAIDERVARAEGNTATPVKYYYHIDHHGSVVETTDGAGTVTQKLSYDEWGNLSPGSTATGEEFRFTGRRYDSETGLYYYRARYYAPQIGRFLQTDSVGYKDDLNLYTYVGNDPLNKSDPSGRSILEVGFLVADVVELGSAISSGEGLGMAILNVAIDTVGVAAPIPGISEAAHAIEGAAHVAEGVTKAVEVTRSVEKTGGAAKAAEKVGLPKPPTGPGKVAKADRDPQRFFKKEDRATKREQQGNKCAECGEEIDQSNSAGHHIDRHADGGATDSANHAEVCLTCHDELHSPEPPPLPPPPPNAPNP